MEMKLNGCCCFDLKTGVLVIGILALIGQILSSPAPFSGNDVACRNFYLKDCSSLSPGEILGIVIYNTVNILFTILMIYGSQKNKAHYLLPTLIMSTIGMVVYFVIIWVVGITAFIHEATGSALGMLMVGHLILALAFYFFMVIYSRYKDLKNDQLPAYPKENYPLYP